MDAKQFFKGLRGKDRRNLTDVLRVLKDNDLDVVVKGSTASKEHNKNYVDIDLLIRGNVGFNYARAIHNIKKLPGASVRTVIEDADSHEYMNTVLNARAYVDYKGTKIDIGFSKNGKPSLIIDIDESSGEVDLLINEDVRRYLRQVI